MLFEKNAWNNKYMCAKDINFPTKKLNYHTPPPAKSKKQMVQFHVKEFPPLTAYNS